MTKTPTSDAREAVADARREAARAQARLAEAAVRYAEARLAEETAATTGSGLSRLKGAKPGEFVAEELSVMLRDQPYSVRCLLARSRRMAADLPTEGPPVHRRLDSGFPTLTRVSAL